MTDNSQPDTGVSLDNPPEELDFHHHTVLPETTPSRALDVFIAGLGRLFSWLWLAVVAVILYSVISRYAFGEGSILLEEVSWHLFGFAWPIGVAYAVVTDDHVRVDVIHERLSLKAQAWIEVLGILLLLLPFVAITVYYSVPYAYDSFARGETSQAPSGLPYRFLLKSIIPISLTLVGIAAISRLLRCTALLFGWPHAYKKPDEGAGD